MLLDLYVFVKKIRTTKMRLEDLREQHIGVNISFLCVINIIVLTYFITVPIVWSQNIRTLITLITIEIIK